MLSRKDDSPEAHTNLTLIEKKKKNYNKNVTRTIEYIGFAIFTCINKGFTIFAFDWK
jgi:hypothetical protein